MRTAELRPLAFEALSVTQLYDLLRLRSEVFVVEQDCVYQDLDGRDHEALHCLRYDGQELMAYTRLLPVGLAHRDACSIGRVVTSPRARGRGYGRQIVRLSIDHCRALWPGADIVIHAQSYLLKFYGSFGFVPEGQEFLEDGIPHFAMRLRATGR